MPLTYQRARNRNRRLHVALPVSLSSSHAAPTWPQRWACGTCDSRRRRGTSIQWLTFCSCNSERENLVNISLQLPYIVGQLTIVLCAHGNADSAARDSAGHVFRWVCHCNCYSFCAFSTLAVSSIGGKEWSSVQLLGNSSLQKGHEAWDNEQVGMYEYINR